jgi:hypothetical protein
VHHRDSRRWFDIAGQHRKSSQKLTFPCKENTHGRTIATQIVFSTSACGFSTVRAPSATAKRMKYHKKNVEEIIFKRQNFI